MWLTLWLRSLGFGGSGSQVQGFRVPDSSFSSSAVGGLRLYLALAPKILEPTRLLTALIVGLSLAAL